MNGAEKIYLDLLEQLGREDLAKKAALKGLAVRPDGRVIVESFSRKYLVGHRGVTAPDQRPVTFHQKLSVVSYLLSNGAGEPAFDFVTLGHLGGFNIGRSRHEDKILKQPILKKFSADYELLAKAALKIGGKKRESDASGKHAWLFHAFPNLPILLIFYERDEEFPADVQILFDKRGLEFLGLKCLGFLPDYFTSSLLSAASAP